MIYEDAIGELLRSKGLRRLPEKRIPGSAGFAFVFEER